MVKIREQLSQQLTDAGYSDFELLSIEESPVQYDGNGEPFYEKTRLLIIFTNRLKGCLLHDPENGMVDFLKDSIAALESITDESKIFYWQIVVNGKPVSGRSTETQILHIFPDNQDNMS